MSIKEDLFKDIKEYMKSKNSDAIEALNILKGEIKNIEIETKKELTDSEIAKTIQSILKTQREVLESYTAAGREDLIKKTSEYIKTLEKYLPKQLSDEEILAKIDEIIAESKIKDFGTLIKTTMSKLGASANGKKVSELLKKRLG